MKLRRLQQDIPSPHTAAKGIGQAIPVSQQCKGIEQAQHRPDDELSIRGAREGDDGFRDSSEAEGSHEGARNGTGEVDVIKLAHTRREAVVDNVVRGLDVEGLLDLGVGSDEEVEEDEGGN